MPDAEDYSLYLADNRANWDERAPAHAASPDYAVDQFVADPGHLSHVVRFDRPRLGDLTGQRAVHLQCHIGTDTISLARLGATMTGLDFSPASIAQARELAARTATPASFVVSDVYAAADVLGRGEFDLVYTGVGALCWLPSIRRWAGVVAALLKPGGRLFIREGHPIMWSLADPLPASGELVIDLPYFERTDPYTWHEGGTYVETSAVFSHITTHEWSHGLGETVTALFDSGMQLTGLTEHDTVPWEAMPGRMVCGEDGEWQLAERPWRMPLSYTLQAVKAG
jgi:SAM-dependent methyltransferase